ncbi:hypothetical protein [Actinomadura sp. 7K534]|uniref:hypothetical protein n=1 Tax=Actinomadura sp. 7K534 TaxID=2530366 RepID=UPI0014050CD1|nr:hypothetical protein [Actinomadura sp. 7K534]
MDPGLRPDGRTRTAHRAERRHRVQWRRTSPADRTPQPPPAGGRARTGGPIRS